MLETICGGTPGTESKQMKFEEMRESSVVTIRCLSAVPVDLESLLAEVEREDSINSL